MTDDENLFQTLTLIKETGIIYICSIKSKIFVVIIWKKK